MAEPSVGYTTTFLYGGAIRRYCLERNGLACGGSNRQPGRPHGGYPAQPPQLQRTDERRARPAHWGGFGSLPGLRQRVTTEQASLGVIHFTFVSVVFMSSLWSVCFFLAKQKEVASAARERKRDAPRRASEKKKTCPAGRMRKNDRIE